MGTLILPVLLTFFWVMFFGAIVNHPLFYLFLWVVKPSFFWVVYPGFTNMKHHSQPSIHHNEVSLAILYHKPVIVPLNHYQPFNYHKPLIVPWVSLAATSQMRPGTQATQRGVRALGKFSSKLVQGYPLWKHRIGGYPRHIYGLFFGPMGSEYPKNIWLCMYSRTSIWMDPGISNWKHGCDADFGCLLVLLQWFLSLCQFFALCRFVPLSLFSECRSVGMLFCSVILHVVFLCVSCSLSFLFMFFLFFAVLLALFQAIWVLFAVFMAVLVLHIARWMNIITYLSFFHV